MASNPRELNPRPPRPQHPHHSNHPAASPPAPGRQAIRLNPPETDPSPAQRPLTIALVMDTVGNQGNGTSNSALQYAQELVRQGHTVRLVGIDAPEYPAHANKVPFVSWVAAKQQMQFAEPNDALFAKAFSGADVVRLFMPFKFGRGAYRVATAMGIPVTAGFHLQPENVTYSAGPLKYLPGISGMLYRLFWHWLYKDIRHIHVPSEMIADQLRRHGYTSRLHVVSNGYSPRFTPKRQRTAGEPPPEPFRIVAPGRLTHEKDQITLIKAIAMSRHADRIELVICGTGPLRRYLRRRAKRLLKRPCSVCFRRNSEMPALLRSCDLFIHPSIADIESLSVLEGMASGLVPVIAKSEFSAAGQFALLDESLFPVRDAAALAERIDWWMDNPQQLSDWGDAYARYTAMHYSAQASVAKFVAMERLAIADAQVRSESSV